MLRAFIKYADGRTSKDSSVASLRGAVADRGCVFWLDMSKPDDEEYSLLDEVFGFHPLAIEDSIKYVQRPKLENYPADVAGGEAYFYMVFHGPDLQTFRQKLRTKELDIFMSARYLVTIHEEEMQSIEETAKRADADPGLVIGRGIDVLLHNILDRIVDHYQPILDYLEEALDELEERALARPEPSVLGQIAVRKRELLNLRRIVGPQREVVAQLTRGEVPFIRESTRVYLRDVQDHLIRTVEMVELYRDLVLGSRDIYLSSISNRLNETMRTLTILSVIALPMTVVTGFFGMNFESIPGLHSRQAFWITVAVMIVAVAGLLYLFRRKGWLGPVSGANSGGGGHAPYGARHGGAGTAEGGAAGENEV
jgi:magnesium transporter